MPPRRHCVVCGANLSDRAARRGYAASPDQPAATLRITSTLMPQLPRADMDGFGMALGVGTALVLVLAALGYYPVALVAGALVVPLLLTIYLYAVDVYEDEPLTVIAVHARLGCADRCRLRAAASRAVPRLRRPVRRSTTPPPSSRAASCCRPWQRR